jgi:hypothetical protein
MAAWRVYLLGKYLTTVFYDADCDSDYVRTSLISHDGYDSRITARREK